MEDSRRCTAKANRTGEQCKNAAIKGSNVCHVHGGAAPQVEKKAQERLDEMADSVTADLQQRLDEVFARLDAAEDGDEYVKLLREVRQLTTSILDRTGHGKTQTQELEHSSGEDDELPGVNIYLDDEYAQD